MPAEPSGNVNRRTSVLFRKSKSMSPQKLVKAGESPTSGPQLGTKTFLSVVLPRLETLLHPRKRSRSASGESEPEEESPVKRLDTGMPGGHQEVVGHGLLNLILTHSVNFGCD